MGISTEDRVEWRAERTNDPRVSAIQPKQTEKANNWVPATPRSAIKQYGGVRKDGPPAPPAALESAELWNRVRDVAQPVAMRSHCLAELVSRKDAGVAAYLADQLPVVGDNPPWRNELIFATEHVELLSDDVRDRVATALLGRAAEMRPAANPDTLDALWAALRRYASLVPQSGADALRHFLTPEDDVVTRQVALRAVKTIFLASPPTAELRGGAIRQLCTRVLELTIKHLDPDWLTPGDNSAIAMGAFDASATIAPEESPVISRRLLALDKPRLVRRALLGLREIEASWGASRVDNRLVSHIRQSVKILGGEG